MNVREFERLAYEHRILISEYARLQSRCSQQIQGQAQKIQAQQSEIMRLRAQVIMRDSRLAWQREDQARLIASQPGLPSRIKLAQRLEAMVERMQQLMREQLRRQIQTDEQERSDNENLAAAEQAADWVICKTGCISHDEYWREADHCKRTGKACKLTTMKDESLVQTLSMP